uniref:Rho GDP-dissociation inhibitor 1 n=1 Tax=Macrostomum lignano TaxID=282301 RepID=A0A1I8IUM7_9PLAT
WLRYFRTIPANVIVQKIQIEFVDDQRAPVELQLLDSDLAELKNNPIVIKEGVNYRVRIFFYVQRDIVSGLRYIQATYKLGVRVAKDDLMVGSYPPKPEPHPGARGPSGMMSRGSYAVKSRFTDDDRNDFLSWEWAIKIKENWKD